VFEFKKKFSQGFALSDRFSDFVFSKYGILRKFEQNFVLFWCFVNFENFLSVSFFENLARGLPYSQNFEVLFATFENFEILKFSKCQFLGKIGQGSALHLKF
jgi:hypothetical protein